MDAPADVPVRFNRLLPYWAVLQTDVRYTLSSWVYRLWVVTSVGGAAGAMLYKVGVHREAGIVQPASVQTEHVLRGLAVGGLGLVALLAVGGIGGERSTVADSVLSRGISRHQYYLAKWHSRLVVVAGTFAVLAAAVLLTAHHFLFDPDVTAGGGLAAVGFVACALVVVVSCGVAVGALAAGTVVGVTLFWLVLYGGLVAASLLPDPYPTPEGLLAKLHLVLRGQTDPAGVGTAAAVAAGLSVGAAAVGMVGFGKKDV